MVDWVLKINQLSVWFLVISGIQVLDISVSSSGVWALNTNGEILFRYGITEEDVSGNYWKKIPGCFTKVSGMEAVSD